ncbi:MAG: fibrobacter succinogenes major paralogous domain-containing protein [Ferruginibacter sp.]
MRKETVSIGQQTWMAENLNVGVFSNGDIIPQALSVQQWAEFLNQKQPAWAYYGFDSVDTKQFGKLYNYFAVTDPRGLAPKIWMIPSDKDWKQLIVFLGGDSIAGKKLKSKDGWERQPLVQEDSSITNPSGIDSHGFNARPNSESYGHWWISTPISFAWSKECLRDVHMWYSYEYGYDEILFGSSYGVYEEYYHTMSAVRCLKRK